MLNLKETRDQSIEIATGTSVFASDPLTSDPLMSVHVHDKSVDLTAYICIHNLGAAGACGGIRCVPDIDEDEVKALARAMAYKYAFFEQAQGGGKGGIVMSYDTPPERRRALAFCLGEHIKPLLTSGMFHAWTDMNFTVDDAAALYAGAGLPVQSSAKNGSSGRTALSALASTMAMAEALHLPPEKCRLAIEGFGSVGGILAQEVVNWGGRIVAVSNRLGTIANDNGLPIDALLKLRETNGARFVQEKGPWRAGSRESLFDVQADILVPCARVESVDEGVARRTSVRAIVPAANVPCTAGAEAILEERDIALLPDFIVNSGGILGFIGNTKQDFDVFVARLKDMVSRLIALAAEAKLSPVNCARHAAARKAAGQHQSFFKTESLGTKIVSLLRRKRLLPRASSPKAQRMRKLFAILDSSFRAI